MNLPKKNNAKLLIVLVLALIVVSIGVLFLMPTNYYPSPKPGTGAVIGKLDFSQQKTTRFTAQDLYLARMIPAGDSAAPPIIEFSYSTDPHTIAHDADGRFAFTDVPPGTYALIVWMPGLSLFIQDENGETEKITVEPDKTVDLGIIIVQ